MRVVVQRVSAASVRVEDVVVGEIGPGLLVLVGVAPTDTAADVSWMAAKLSGLRIFPDAEGKLNLDVGEAGGRVLVVSQFTLYGDCAKGRRPSFNGAARPDLAEPLYEALADALRAERGRFGADMKVALVNDGPVTLVIDSPARA